MKHRLFITFISLTIFSPLILGAKRTQKHNLPIEKIVIWGHKLHTHTHSYIHWGFFKAFKYLGYQTYWFDKNDILDKFNFSQSLFITAGNCDHGIPLREDCFYILHYCDFSKYEHLFKKGRCIDLKVYWHYFKNKEATFIDDFTFYNLDENYICMPWATDLLPYEIDEIKKQMPFVKKPYAYFIGSPHSGTNSTKKIFEEFQKACLENNIQFKITGLYSTNSQISNDEHMKLIQNSLLAPALQGQLQIDLGYIPCRIFKNISYGQLGITNSKTVYEFFNKKIVYNPGAYQLCYDALKRLKTISLAELHETMDFVKEKHTYLNRIDTLLSFLELVYNNYKKKNTKIIFP
ncbi:hypothetical protein E3J79_04540 [Candidatus Dependentiae bacterium]|nr:MAG: hypothetical protein E3J79_04540 [Candidatus Dependentiae bacterium]